jgi:hypothetical protein
MVEERKIAKPGECPIHNDISGTHESYNSNVVSCLENFKEDSCLMIASHNDVSIKLGIETI